jgi:two-component system, NtrC family, response regulator AtoC
MAKFLIADDEPEVLDFLIDVLEADGHEATCARDWTEAWDLLNAHVFDVVITDLRIAGRDALDLMAHAHSRSPDTQVIVITAHGSVSSAVRAMRDGAFDYVEKTFASPEALRLIASRALERRQQLKQRARTVQRSLSLPPLSHGDPRMAPVVSALSKVAPTDTCVLLLGETGTGKEIAARTLHALSRRSDGPFVAVNCAALSEELLESELFGHERGAFTGATAQRRGRIELAEGGTFFLDEIGELKPLLQAKLLRVLQERQFERVGGTRTQQANVRWIAATNRDLTAMVHGGHFREDLYHRIAVFPLHLPPLRERRQDLLPIASQLLEQLASAHNRPKLGLSADAQDWLLGAELGGNIRELSNRLERAAILASGDEIDSRALSDEPGLLYSSKRTPYEHSIANPWSLEIVERETIQNALAFCQGNRRRAAELLGIGVRTLYEKLKRWDSAH